MERSGTRLLTVCLLLLSIVAYAAVQGSGVAKIGGTLVVAVPVAQGLVVCSDKRLYNETTNTIRDDFTKIQKVNDKSLFVATHTTGFLNDKTGKMAFDIFDLTQDYVSRHGFAPSTEYWNAIRSEIRSKLLSYLSKLSYRELPETDVENNRLLFNLVFFSVEGQISRSYSISVFYEKAKTPIVDVAGVVGEMVRTPKLIGKGKDVMGLFAREPALGRDPSILRFDESIFNILQTSVFDAVKFASRLFSLTNANLPQAEVSAAHDCALLSYADRFSWIDDSGQPVSQAGIGNK